MKKRQKHVEKNRERSKLRQRPSKNVKNLTKFFKIIKNHNKCYKSIKNHQKLSRNQ